MINRDYCELVTKLSTDGNQSHLFQKLWPDYIWTHFTIFFNEKGYASPSVPIGIQLVSVKMCFYKHFRTYLIYITSKFFEAF